MEILNLKVVNNYRLVKLFAIGFCNSCGRAVGKSKNIASFKILCSYPLIYYPERMYRRGFNLIIIDENMNKYIGFLTECSYYFLILTFIYFGTCGVNKVFCFISSNFSRQVQLKWYIIKYFSIFTYYIPIFIILDTII